MVEVIPSVLTNDPTELKELLAQVEMVGGRVSIDIIDGQFVDNRTIDPSALRDVYTDLDIEYQLIVVEPIKWVEKCFSGQADRIIGHIEQMSDQKKFVEKGTSMGISVGLALDIGTKVSELDPVILNNLDVVLVMNYPVGFPGQPFDERVIKKIKKLDEIRSREDSPFRIHSDGGVSIDNIAKLRKAGVDEVSVGRSLFKGDLKDNIKKFTKAAHK